MSTESFVSLSYLAGLNGQLETSLRVNRPMSTNATTLRKRKTSDVDNVSDKADQGIVFSFEKIFCIL